MHKDRSLTSRHSSDESWIGRIFEQEHSGLNMEQATDFKLTIKFLENPLHSTRAATAAHGNVEFVVVFRHVRLGCGAL